MEERIAPKHVKIVGDEGGVPIDFAFWIQLQPAGPDTRMRLVLHIELNMMMKMMIGGKLQTAVDQIAEGTPPSTPHRNIDRAQGRRRTNRAGEDIQPYETGHGPSSFSVSRFRRPGPTARGRWHMISTGLRLFPPMRHRRSSLFTHRRRW